jgi:hypothetical protein
MSKCQKEDDDKTTICWNYDYDTIGNTVLYMVLFAIIIFITHVFYSIYFCGKFSFNSFGISIIALVIITLYYTLILNNTKITSVTGVNKSNYKEGDYYLKTTSEKINNYLILFGNLIFLIFYIYSCYTNKTTYFNCNSPIFPWNLIVIIVIAWSILTAKSIINVLRKN